MANINKISYLDRTFEDYREELKEYTKKYYPDLVDSLDDASVGQWLIDLVASVSDHLSYYVDRAYNETNIDTATQKSSIYALARTFGLKVPGPKGAMTEVVFSCELPLSTTNANPTNTINSPNWYFAPIIKKGTKLSSRGQVFEVMEDIDFAENFDENGIADRELIPMTSTNGVTGYYEVRKRATVIAGESKIYKQVINASDITPFMEIIIPDEGVMNVESIIFKDGADYQSDPLLSEFTMDKEFVPAVSSPTNVDTYRFFEVESLTDQYRWGDEIVKDNSEPQKYYYGYYDNESGQEVPVACITKGQWRPITQKFITEFTDNGYLKVIFGSGEVVQQEVDYTNASNFSQHQISRMVRNNFLGRLPKEGMTMYIRYRRGGGESSNIAAGALTTISYLNVDFCRNGYSSDDARIVSAIRNSIKVTNTIPSVSGKDAPTTDEIRAMIKYNSGAQQRCVTLKDYQNRISLIPSRYGCPFRSCAIEENNKVMIYVLGLDYQGHLSNTLPQILISNLENYLSMYRSINDYVEIKSGRIINVSFEIEVYVEKNYNSADVVRNIINTVKDYMDIKGYMMGDDIYVNNINTAIGNVDGVLNLIDLRVYNETDSDRGYSDVRTSQPVVTNEDNNGNTGESKRVEIDLEASDYILNSESDEMFEIRFPETDIKVNFKIR